MYVILSKLFWFLAAPSSLLVLLLSAGTLAMALTRQRRGFRLVAASTIALCVVWTLPVGEWALLPLERRFPRPTLPEHVDGIVMAMGSFNVARSIAWQSATFGAAHLTSAAALARRYPTARLLITGGDPWIRQSGGNEAELARAILASLGVPEDRIVVEPQARNKYENARYSYALAAPDRREVWLLIAGAAQMPRALGAFRRAGWSNLVPYPVNYESDNAIRLTPQFDLPKELRKVNAAVHEWLGLVVYWELDRTSELYPRP